MRKLIVLIIFLSLLVGCANEKKQVIEEDVGSENTIETVEKVEDMIEKTDDDVISQEITEEVVEEKIEELKPKYILNHQNFTVKPIDENENQKVVLLTIDDAPEHYSVEMAKLLNEEGINAIFFVNGHFILDEKGREKLKTIYDLGFEIGNHTMNHPNLRDLSEEEQRKEIIELNDLLEEIIGERPRFFRAPFGVNTEVSRQVVEEEKMQAMNWTYGYDYFQPYMNAEALAEAMITGKAPEVGVNHSLLIPGANLLMHDRKWTLEALPAIISGLRNKGYEFVDPSLIKG